jgi:hypothetical protein
MIEAAGEGPMKKALEKTLCFSVAERMKNTSHTFRAGHGET